MKTVYLASEDAAETEFKTFDDTLEVGELVVIPTGTRHGFTVVKISAVDIAPDWESDKPIDWIAGKFDPSHYVGIQAQETKILETVSEAERAQRAKEIKETMFAHVDPKTLQISNDVSTKEHEDES